MDMDDLLDDAAIVRGAAMRDSGGFLTAREIERLRRMLDLGLHNVDIAREMRIDRTTVMLQRRTYDAVLIDEGRAPTSARRTGRTSGRPLTRQEAAKLRMLLLKGTPAPRAAIALDISKTCATRHRNALIAELAGKGRTLPGCDARGAVIGRRSANAITERARADVERRLVAPERISAIAANTGVSKPTVRRIWKTLRTQLKTVPACPCGKEAHHPQRCRPTASTAVRHDAVQMREMVERHVPRHIDQSLRADIVQDVTMAILSLPAVPADIAATVRKEIAANYARYANRWGDLSLDAPVGDGTSTLLDLMAERPTT